jgi:hypothetical protein
LKSAIAKDQSANLSALSPAFFNILLSPGIAGAARGGQFLANLMDDAKAVDFA